MSKKHLCNCGKLAVWLYMPGYENNENSFVCDDCVDRGCQCNYYSIREEDYNPPIKGGILPTEEDYPIKWINDYTWTKVDEKGREYPCCEYTYNENGFNIMNWFERKIIYSKLFTSIRFFIYNFKHKNKKI